jgi:phosphotransacetylase
LISALSNWYPLPNQLPYVELTKQHRPLEHTPFSAVAQLTEQNLIHPVLIGVEFQDQHTLHRIEIHLKSIIQDTCSTTFQSIHFIRHLALLLKNFTTVTHDIKKENRTYTTYMWQTAT